MTKMKNFLALILCFIFTVLPYKASLASESRNEMRQVIGDITKIYLSSMVYIFKHQELINQKGGDKDELFGDSFMENVKAVFETKYKDEFPKNDYFAIRMLVQAMVEVMEDNKPLLNDTEIGFKGFIPAIFAFQLSEKLSIKGIGLKIKFTRTKAGLRNTFNFPDAWEIAMMEKIIRTPRIYYDENATLNGRPAYRQFTPLPMKPYCLNCHGKPENNPLNYGKKEADWTNVDMTGFPMENWSMQDFGGGVSVSIEKSNLHIK